MVDSEHQALKSATIEDLYPSRLQIIFGHGPGRVYVHLLGVGFPKLRLEIHYTLHNLNMKNLGNLDGFI